VGQFEFSSIKSTFAKCFCYSEVFFHLLSAAFLAMALQETGLGLFTPADFKLTHYPPG
jgi:hypothetical protein